jgi:hypothetical protein
MNLELLSGETVPVDECEIPDPENIENLRYLQFVTRGYFMSFKKESSKNVNAIWGIFSLKEK